MTSLAFLDVYEDTHSNQYILVSWATEHREALDQPRSGVVVPWGTPTRYLADEMSRNARDVFFADLAEFRARDPINNPISPPNLRFPVNSGLIVLKKVTVELIHDQEAFRFCPYRRGWRGIYEPSDPLEIGVGSSHTDCWRCFNVALSRSERWTEEKDSTMTKLALSKMAQFKRRLRGLVGILEARGFYKYALLEAVPMIKDVTLQTGTLFPDFYTYEKGAPRYKIVQPEPDGTHRAYFVDSEDLCEQGIATFLQEVAPILKRYGIGSLRCEEKRGESDYSVRVNGKQFLVWTGEQDKDGDLWSVATDRAVEIVNKLLWQEKTAERLFYDYRGNDTKVAFLTDEMYRIIVESGAIPEIDILQGIRTKRI